MKRLLFVIIFSLCFVYGFGKKLAVLPEVNRPTFIEIDGNKIFILDGVNVKVYSMKDYRFLTMFGKEGQGPGELIPNDEIPIQMQLFESNLLLNSQSKIIFYSKRGEYIKEKKVPYRWIQIVPLGKNFVLTKTIPEKTGGVALRVTFCDPQLNELKTLVKYRRENADSKRRRITFPPPWIFLNASPDKIFIIGGSERNFVVTVFDQAGNQLETIKMPYQPLKLTDSIKKEVYDWLKSDVRFKTIPEELKKLIYFPDYLPAIRDLKVKDNKLYIQTYKKENNRSEFFIFDFKGILLKKIFLPQSSGDIFKLNTNSTFTIFNNKYYYLVENMEEENWELHMEEIK
jgi:hypothetical protein